MTTPLRRRRADILVVEDNPGDVYLLEQAFATAARAKLRLHIVHDGEDAMAFLRREGPHDHAPRPDVVLLDLNLPRKSGREVLVDIRSSPSLRKIPVVVMTGSDADEDVAEAYDLGANVYVTKPTSPDNLTKLVTVLEDLWLVLGRLPPK